MNSRFIVFGVIGFLVVCIVLYIVLSQKSTLNGASMMKNEEPTSVMKNSANSRYVVYSKKAFDAMTDKKRVLYFHADWCPVCRPLDKEFSQNSDKIPADVVLFKTNYDKEEVLKTKYGVTYQHTFVQIDDRGGEATSWNGGGISELATRVK